MLDRIQKETGKHQLLPSVIGSPSGCFGLGAIGLTVGSNRE
jgi:hypothetical protein